MIHAGTLHCDNCDSKLALRWVNVQRAYRTHHVDTECPLCGSPAAIDAWLEEGRRAGQTRILVQVEPQAK